MWRASKRASEGGGERERERERERRETGKRDKYMRETSIGCPLIRIPTTDGPCNLGMWPDLESNLGPFGLWDDAPTD